MFQQIKHISTNYHGLNSADTILLIKTVLSPRIFYGGILWLNDRIKSKVNKKLQLIFNKAARLVMGVQQSNPITFLTRDRVLESFLQVHIRQTHNLIRCSYTKEGDPIQAILDR
ncbi:hypothetical protein O181_008374 [Austropuccinia psidii MF-1]|uniref:Uncharacterized protein n=1 Tax=Austropuccinia psidii MF-1 TaxID=1389203 RepID=A0A9Q3BMH5_9BASI|nr:hypothetical protein [Austropuccinia psidii MF-1]